ncbi:MAG: hypothetical protein ABI876_01895, partial [Bacteroidota bacterium]
MPAVNLMTAEDIAGRVGVSKRAVLKRAGIDQFVADRASRGGRPVNLYTATALSLWGIQTTTPSPADKQRKGRSDHGAPRKCSAESWQLLTETARALYMASAQGNLRLACEQTCRQLAAQGVIVPITHKQLYKRLTCKNTGTDGLPISEFYRENWEAIRSSGLRKKDLALKVVTARYDWLSIFESCGWAGEGFGALRVWSIDVRHGDAWSIGDDGKPHLPSAVYIRCGLTGMPLMVYPIETESSEAIIRAVLQCMIRWQRVPDVAYAIDNGSAMVAERTLGVLNSTLPESAWERAAEMPEIFGANRSPILRNLPNIPRAPFKAALERSFKHIKDEYDANRFALTYQGGDRSEAVQLRVSNRPSWQYLPEVVRSSTSYFSGLDEWLYSDYIARLRPAM